MISSEHLAGECDAAAFSTLIHEFQETIQRYLRENPRPMPWRETRDPYRILVSEVMLQQTQVERVRYKYDEFLTAFPTVSDLAAASLPEVLKVWQGLGYNRRALALKRCACEIMGRFGGLFPATVDELESLPGLGPYTARAVALFAFGVVEPFIETNIRTVFIHFFFHGKERVHDREIMPLVEATLDLNDTREWYYALMDYGVMLKRCHVNPGRRSVHHARQAPFKGSNRELRSRMLSMIMARPEGIGVDVLTALLDAEASSVEGNLRAMEREGFVVREAGEVYVRQH